MLSAICANSSITPAIRPLPGRAVLNPLAGSIASVRNGSVDFNSKPSCWSSVKRTLASLLRKVVRVARPFLKRWLRWRHVGGELKTAHQSRIWVALA